ncbi:1,4-alpha-glucan branching protein GlgB [Peptococcaceae bacterium]|nr:1,4-alpha-glucan branching protein GlgB [Peptococcaceae bacterium]
MLLSNLNEYDLYLYHEGTNFRSYWMLGAHLTQRDGSNGVRFAVWAPNAREVRVVGDFNHWQGGKHVLEKIDQSGVWSIFIPDLKEGDLYKYEIHTYQNEILFKIDPYGFYSEQRPKTASIVFSLQDYQWHDQEWLKRKQLTPTYQQPVLIYEVHLSSWRRKKENKFYSYRELAHQLVDYVVKMGYTHIELLPLAEHPYDGSWGYQATEYYAVTSRYGTPHDFMYFIDQCHQRGIGVILDWVPGHFCKDAHGLAQFDGTALYEHENIVRSDNLEWGTVNFDFDTPEVQSFLISNAMFWFDVFHIDGLRVDAVAQMLYLNFAKEDDQWLPNKYGGHENLAAVDFMKKLNKAIFASYPEAMMIAEESTQWALVTMPTYLGGLGYNYKWNMGWMNDILRYMETDPIYRKNKHHLITFSFMYAFSENFVLPLSHDEVVHYKKSLLNKMPGDYWQKFANLRLLYGYMIAHPGKKLLFMGGEFGQFIEWQYQDSLDWHLLTYDLHAKLHHYVQTLNHYYQRENTLWELDHSWQGFEWIDADDASQSVVTFMRKGKTPGDFMIVVCNFTPVVRTGYRVGVPQAGLYREVFNSDLEMYGGSGQKNDGVLKSVDQSWHNQPYLLEVKLPPLAVIFLKLIETG